MKNQEMIEEMANDLGENLRLCAGVKLLDHQVETIAYELLKKYQPKLPQCSVINTPTVQTYSTHDNDLVALSKEEYSKNLQTHYYMGQRDTEVYYKTLKIPETVKTILSLAEEYNKGYEDDFTFFIKAVKEKFGQE